MVKRPKTEWMGAAECARHTGLTVRALRVYEKQGLIVPSRSANGWRRYGPKELTRLGTIVTLKAMGLSLAQIREVLTGKAPSLERVLQMQRQVWLARRAAAEKSLSMVEAALSHLRSRQSLEIAELCELIRSVGMNGNWQATALDLMYELLEPQERREWLAWVAARPKKQSGKSQKHFEEHLALMRELHALMESGAKPQDEAVQHLLERINRSQVRNHSRERMLEQMRWNPTIARKVFEMGNRMLLGSDSADGRGRQLRAFMADAAAVSPCGQAMKSLIEDTTAEMTHSQPDSPAAQALAERLARVCKRYALGDAPTYARWVATYLQPRDNESADHFERRQAAWTFLAGAAELAGPKKKTPRRRAA